MIGKCAFCGKQIKLIENQHKSEWRIEDRFCNERCYFQALEQFKEMKKRESIKKWEEFYWQQKEKGEKNEKING